MDLWGLCWSFAWVYEFLLELGFEVFKSMNTCWVLGILLTSPLVFMFRL